MGPGWSEDALVAEARSWLRAALEAYRSARSDGILTGLAVECDPGEGAVYLHLRTERDGDQEHPGMWREAYAEQSGSGTEAPPFTARYLRLIEANHRDELRWHQVEEHLERVLDALVAAVRELREHGLAEYGIAEDALLSVFTEDDGNARVGRCRVSGEPAPQPPTTNHPETTRGPGQWLGRAHEMTRASTEATDEGLVRSYAREAIRALREALHLDPARDRARENLAWLESEHVEAMADHPTWCPRCQHHWVVPGPEGPEGAFRCNGCGGAVEAGG